MRLQAGTAPTRAGNKKTAAAAPNNNNYMSSADLEHKQSTEKKLENESHENSSKRTTVRR